MTAPRFVRLDAAGLGGDLYLRADAIEALVVHSGRESGCRIETARNCYDVRESPAEVLALLAAPAPWQLPADAGICADDLDECTVTLALSSEAEVRAARAALPLRNRVRVMPDTRHRPAPSVEVTEAVLDAAWAAYDERASKGGDAMTAAIEAADRARGAAGMNPMQIVNQQADDEGLWFVAETAAEAYLQQELRRLHAAVETQQKVLSLLHEEMAGANLGSPQSMRMNILLWTNRVAVELDGLSKRGRS